MCGVLVPLLFLDVSISFLFDVVLRGWNLVVSMTDHCPFKFSLENTVFITIPDARKRMKTSCAQMTSNKQYNPTIIAV